MKTAWKSDQITEDKFSISQPCGPWQAGAGGLGRLCRFHLWEPNQFGMHKAMTHEEALREHGPGIKRAYTYKALNKLIQGSAADMTKKSMLELYKEGIIPHIQIHDELDLSIESDKQAKKIIEVMENAVTLEVPNKVDYESGKNWGSIND